MTRKHTSLILGFACLLDPNDSNIKEEARMMFENKAHIIVQRASSSFKESKRQTGHV